jgi:hypothetical protein
MDLCIFSLQCTTKFGRFNSRWGPSILPLRTDAAPHDHSEPTVDMLNDPHSPRLASHGFRRRKLGTVGPYPESQCTASPSTAETTVDRRHNLASASLSFSTSGDHDAVLATSAEGKTKENTKEEHNSSRHSMVRVALVGGEGGGVPRCQTSHTVPELTNGGRETGYTRRRYSVLALFQNNCGESDRSIDRSATLISGASPPRWDHSFISYRVHARRHRAETKPPEGDASRSLHGARPLTTE